jgi:two-component system copper resistance phosphate regulon response regulator CusR
MKVLVVEDDRKSAAYLRNGLSTNGFSVDVSHEGEEALEMGKQFGYDLMILDLLLPGAKDGWSVMSELRRAGFLIPTIVLTGLGSVNDKVKSLRLGADDHMVKPFAFSELLARIESVLRRAPVRHTDVIRIANLEIDVLRNKVSRDGTPLHLTRKEFQLLSLLARHPGDVFSRTLIAEQIWDMNFDSDTNVVEVHVRRLRAKVDDPFQTKLIYTVRGLGYVLEERGAESR